MKSHKLLLGCGIAVILVLGALAVAGILLATGVPEVEHQIPEGISLNMANITLPLNGATLPIGKPVSVYVQASGDLPLQDIQLWVDGVQQPVGNSSPAGANKMMSAWTWTPIEEGQHTLLARSNTQSGQAGISNAVHINALSADKIPQPPILKVTTEPLIIHDDTNLIIPGSYLDDGTTAPPPPGFNEQGELINAPQPVVEEPSSQEPPAGPSEQPGGSLIPIKYSLWAQGLKNDIFGGKVPAAPKLWGSASNCDTVLTAQDNSDMEVGFFLYRLDPGHLSFSRILTWGSKAGKAVISYHDTVPASGKYLYYLSAFNSEGESASNIIAVTVDDPQCPAAKNIIGVSSIPIEFSQPVDHAYCYNSTNGSPWERLPYGENTFIFPVNGKFDLASYWNSIHLPELTPQKETLNLECWGWIGSTLVSLGSQTITYPYGGGGDPGGTLGEPPKYLVSSPFNVSITSDPNVCKDHVPNYPSVVQQCQNTMANSGGYLLVWDYNRFGTCNPQSEQCDEDIQPANRFFVYNIREGGASLYNIQPLDGLFYTYVPLFDEDEYFVRAYSNAYGHSADSNHVVFKGPLLETTLKPTYSISSTFKTSNYNGSPPHWANTPGLQPGELQSGYSFSCNNSCSNQQYFDHWKEANVEFNLPEHIEIETAVLSWENVSYNTLGFGDNNMLGNCGVNIKDNYLGISFADELSQGTDSINVTQPILLEHLKGYNQIKFSFNAPFHYKPTVRWDRCLWTIKNLSLTLSYHDVDYTPWYTE